MKNILFVCVENANRSQMAEAFGHLYKGDNLEVYSAGSKPAGKINEKAVKAMAVLGYDLTTHQSTNINQLENIKFDVIISMGCGDDCPNIEASIREDWQIPDPKNLTEADYWTIRDYIKIKVKQIITDIS